MLESMISELNKQNFESVEIARGSGMYGDTYNLIEAIHTFKKNDFQKTVQLITKLNRRETRIFFKLQLLQDRRYNLESQLFRFRTCRD